MPLTPKQELFAQLLASGSTRADAYRHAYNVSPNTSPATVYQEGHVLSIHPNISLRVQELRTLHQSGLAAAQRWNLDKIVSEAETQLELSREGGWRGVSSGNGALELIGRATGLLSDRPRDPQLPAITRVVVVLTQGSDAGGQARVTEAAYEVLPLTAPTEEDGSGAGAPESCDDNRQGAGETPPSR